MPISQERLDVLERRVQEIRTAVYESTRFGDERQMYDRGHNHAQKHADEAERVYRAIFMAQVNGMPSPFLGQPERIGDRKAM